MIILPYLQQIEHGHIAKIHGLIDPILDNRAIGGVVYNHCRDQARASSRPPTRGDPSGPMRSATILKVSVRKLWANCDEWQRTYWGAIAVNYESKGFGGNYHVWSGYELFVACNIHRQLLGLSVIYEPGWHARYHEINTLSVTGHTAHIHTTWTVSHGADVSVELWLSGPSTGARAADKGRRYFTARAPSNLLAYTITDLAPGWYTVWSRYLCSLHGDFSPWPPLPTEEWPNVYVPGCRVT